MQDAREAPCLTIVRRKDKQVALEAPREGSRYHVSERFVLSFQNIFVWRPELSEERQDRQDIDRIGERGKVQTEAYSTPVSGTAEILADGLAPKALLA